MSVVYPCRCLQRAYLAASPHQAERRFARRMLELGAALHQQSVAACIARTGQRHYVAHGYYRWQTWCGQSADDARRDWPDNPNQWSTDPAHVTCRLCRVRVTEYGAPHRMWQLTAGLAEESDRRLATLIARVRRDPDAWSYWQAALSHNVELGRSEPAAWLTTLRA